MTALLPEQGALRTRLDEVAWAAAVETRGLVLPEWARPRADGWSPAPRSTTSDDVPADLAPHDVAPDEPSLDDALALRDRAVLAVDVATTSGGGGVLAELTTDLTSVLGLTRRVRVPDGPTPGIRVLRGVEVSAAPLDRLVDEVLRLLPPVPTPERLEPVEVAEELTVALGRALREGDAATVDAVCTDHGWGGVPEVLLALVQEHLGSATVTVRRAGAGPVVGHWLLTRRTWVELVRTRDETVRHVPRTREDLARSLVTALTAAVSAALATPGGVDG